MSYDDATSTDELDLDVATARLDDAEHALDNLRRISDGLPQDDYCEDVADALNAMGIVLAELRRRRAQVDALVQNLIDTSHRCQNRGEAWPCPSAACECGHERGSHDALGNCWHLDQAGDEDCGCDQYRLPVLASDDRTRGLYGKYRVERVSDPTGKHDHCRYFVLDPQHDPHAVTALRAYADAVRGEFPQLAADLDDWVGAAAEPPGETDGLREQIARAYCTWVASPYDPTHWQAQNGEDLADAVLSLPAVRALLDDAARLALVRVIASNDWRDDEATGLAEIRRALDGDGGRG